MADQNISSRKFLRLPMSDRSRLMKNKRTDTFSYFLIRCCSRQLVKMVRGKSSGESLVKDWNKIQFSRHDRGGIRNYFEDASPICKRFEMHVTTSKEGFESHYPHSHRAEEILLATSDKTEMQIGDNTTNAGT